MNLLDLELKKSFLKCLLDISICIQQSLVNLIDVFKR